MRWMGFEGGSGEHPELMVDPDSVQPSGHLTSVVATTSGVSVVDHQGVVGFQTKIALRSFTTTTIIRNLLIVFWYPSYMYLKSISTLSLDHFNEDVVFSLSSSFTWQSSITLDPVTISGLVEAVNIWEEFLTSMVKSLILEVSLSVTASQVYTPSSSCWILSNVTLLVRRSSDIFHEKIKC